MNSNKILPLLGLLLLLILAIGSISAADADDLDDALANIDLTDEGQSVNAIDDSNMVNDVNLNKIESSSSRMAMSFIASQIEHILESSIYRNICFSDYNEYLQIKNSSDMDQKKMDQSKREDIIRKKEQLEIAMRSQNSLNFKYYYYFIYDRNKWT